MRRPQRVIIARFNFIEAVKIVSHIAIWRRHDCRRPPHNVIAGQTGILFFQTEAEVIGRVPWRFNRLERPTRAFKHITIARAFIWREASIIFATKLAFGCRFAATLRIDFTARPFSQRLGQRRVIGMAMRDQNVFDGLAFKRSF